MATAPDKQPAMAGTPNKGEKEADLVMGTNSSSIVSKRSVEKLYYREPHYFRYFVKKPQRRSPLINRGYWLRMYAMMETVRRFMEEPSNKPKYVLNLGCGYDPLPFLLLSSDNASCRNTKFVDIDYEKLMVNKKAVIQKTGEIKNLLEDIEFLSDDDAPQIRSKQYIALGCDLKNLTKLDDVLRNDVLPSDCSILCTAEVSLTYMDVNSADAVINFTSALSNDVQFCLLEQFFPDGPGHPFASTMMSHFNKLRAPLYSIHEYPSLRDQEKRFKNAGWRQAQARSLWDLWSDETFLSASSRMSLDAVEPFDEWEEFAIFASHYFLLIASTGQDSGNSSTEATDGSEHRSSASCQLAMSSHCKQRKGQRRYGALIPDSEKSLGHHGGLGRQSRLASTDLYTSSESLHKPLHPFPARDVPARMCHTVTPLNDSDCLLVGGRTSPASALADCWLRQANAWRPTHSIPTARFRHSATKITQSVLVYGGKSSNGEVLDDWLLWDEENGWQVPETIGIRPSARFGACMESITDTSGVMFGGIGQDGTMLQDFWIWRVSHRGDGTVFVELFDATESMRSATPLFEYINRFGATVNHTSWGLVVAGGIIPRRAIPFDKEIMLLNGTELLGFLDGDKRLDKNVVSTIDLTPEFKEPRPLLIGHASWAIDPNQLLLLGGGAVCFSFGTFWSEGTWLLKRADSSSINTWTLLSEFEEPGGDTKKPSSKPKTGQYEDETKDTSSIPRVHINTPAQFQQIVATGKPVVIEGSDIGPCTSLWTKEYLTNTVGQDRKVVVHEAQSENMNFQSKNFSYVTKDFGAFLDEVHAGGRQYLRSISAEQPSKLPANMAADFPSISNDFRLPDQFSMVTENMHSSPLRISGPVTIWLHYDVMANILCQIRGERRLILFPPHDVQHLHLPSGSSNSNISLFQDLENGSTISIPGTSPHEAILKPGDILFIPPLWLHTACPCPTREGEGQVTVAVNVFFRNLTRGYAAGRDVYGNRDVQAYERSRQDLQRIGKSFEGLPADMARFYLLRLAQELQDMAEL